MLHPRGFKPPAGQSRRQQIRHRDRGVEGCAGQHAREFLGDSFRAAHLRKVIMDYGNLHLSLKVLRNSAGPLEHRGNGSGKNLQVQYQ
jgi:hypothetical protein